MADAKISALTAVVTPAGTDTLACVQGGVTKKLTVTQLLTNVSPVATLASTVTVVDSTSATTWVGIFDAATGSLAPKTDGALIYNATTGVLGATIFNGPIGTGTATPAAGSFTTLAASGAITASAGDGTGLISIVNDASTNTWTWYHSSGGNVLTLRDVVNGVNVLDFNPAATPVVVVTATVNITGTLAVTGTLTTNGGLQTFGANDSGGAGYRLVLVPNA